MLLPPKVLAIVLLSLAVQQAASQFCSVRGCCSGEDDSCSAPDGNGGACYCDYFCLLTHDCCPDFASTCDEDECATEPPVCHVNATCHNTVGSYECVCKEGFVGNGAHCVDETLGPCATHTSISEPRRSSSFVPGPNDALICDNVLPAGWYRFVTDTGGKMPETCVDKFHCGTQVPIWLNGAHPTDYQVVDRDGCMNYGVPGDCCTLTVQIQVQRCPSSNGNPDFFIYNLQPTFACDVGYCADPTPVDTATTVLPTRRIPARTVGSSRSEPSATGTMMADSMTVSQVTAAVAARTSAAPTDSGGAPSTARSTSTKPEENKRTAVTSTASMDQRTRTGGPAEQQSASSTRKRTVTAAGVTEKPDPTPVDTATTALPSRRVPLQTVGSSRSETSATRTARAGTATVSQGTAAVAGRSSATPTDSGRDPSQYVSTVKSTSTKPEEKSTSRTADDSTTPMEQSTRTGGPDEEQSAAPMGKRTVTAAGVTESQGATSATGIIIGATCGGLIFILVTSIIICVLCRKRKPWQNTKKVTAGGDGAMALGNLKKTDGNLYDVIIDKKGSQDPLHGYTTLSSFSSQLAGSVNIGGGGFKDQQSASKPGAGPPSTEDHTYQSLGPTDPENNHGYQSLTTRGHDYENSGFVSNQQAASKPGAAPPSTEDHTYQSLGPTDSDNNHDYQSLTPLGHD
ncbi:UMOD [Branchiostoma lanceolatum]|uniref:UMOD protein n=1 Tax=Branchiostoma lanceolatum TaxID=7740 RepID=A0A8S4MP04_BRALA|nr:UMOD [Branchiostoma lanceolatum]